MAVKHYLVGAVVKQQRRRPEIGDFHFSPFASLEPG